MDLRRVVNTWIGMEESGSRAFRRQRFRLFLELVDDVLRRRPVCRILDVGGEPAYWRNVADLLGERRCEITLLNQEVYPVDSARMISIAGDARDMGQFGRNSFDLAHSNSVIEHVGRWPDMVAMATEVRRVAPAYFVQTPNFWFPVEPHCATAFFHWMPEPVRIRMLMGRERGGWGRASDVPTAMRQIQSSNLLDARMLATLFPDATLRRERLVGLTKSLIAVRQPG